MMAHRASVKYDGGAVVELRYHRDGRSSDLYEVELRLRPAQLEALVQRAVELYRRGKRRPATAARGGVQVRVRRAT